MNTLRVKTNRTKFGELPKKLTPNTNRRTYVLKVNLKILGRLCNQSSKLNYLIINTHVRSMLRQIKDLRK